VLSEQSGVITIDVSDNGRDRRLFGGPVSDLTHWLKAAAWSLEEAVAISLGYEPEVLNIPKILRVCPEEIRDRHLRRRHDVFYRFSDLIQMFLGRLSLLERAIIARELEATLVDGKYWLKPADFLRWFDAQTTEDWKEHVRVAMLGILKAWSASGAAADEGKTGFSSTGAKGKDPAKHWLFSLMVEFPKTPPPQFKKKPLLEKYVMEMFELKQRDFREVFQKAEKMSGSDLTNPLILDDPESAGKSMASA
jgi:hypothetical protein